LENNTNEIIYGRSGVVSELMTIEEAANFLNVKVSKLRREVFRRSIRYFKLGALIRFRKADLVRWIEARIVNPITLVSI
jgi:excisionase family DNA binding protein